MRDARQAFIKLGNKRVNKAIDQIRLIGNLGNKTNYTYTTREARKIFKKLREELREAESYFSKTKKPINFEFHLEEECYE